MKLFNTLAKYRKFSVSYLERMFKSEEETITWTVSYMGTLNPSDDHTDTVENGKSFYYRIGVPTGYKVMVRMGFAYITTSAVTFVGSFETDKYDINIESVTGNVLISASMPK